MPIVRNRKSRDAVHLLVVREETTGMIGVRRAGSLLALAIAWVLAAPGVLGAEPSADPAAWPPDLQVEMVPVRPIPDAGALYQVTLTVTNASSYTVDADAAIRQPVREEFTTLCGEYRVTLEPGASVSYACDMQLPRYLSCDTEWYDGVYLVAHRDDGTAFQYDVPIPIDIDSLPPTCPAAKELQLSATGTFDGPPLIVGETSTGTIDFSNTGNMNLEVATIYLAPVDGARTDPPQGRCDVFVMLRPGDSSSWRCEFTLEAAAPCDVEIVAWQALALSELPDGYDHYVPVLGEPFEVDVAGVGACTAGATPEPPGVEPTPLTPTTPPTDTDANVATTDRGDLGVPVIALWASICAVVLGLARRRPRPVERG